MQLRHECATTPEYNVAAPSSRNTARQHEHVSAHVWHEHVSAGECHEHVSGDRIGRLPTLVTCSTARL